MTDDTLKRWLAAAYADAPMDGLVEALRCDRAAEASRLRKEAEAAKLALAEPAGESPPFIVMLGGMSLVELIHDEATLTGRHWTAARMSKDTAEATVRLIDFYYPGPKVIGWRAATDKFIEINETIITELTK